MRVEVSCGRVEWLRGGGKSEREREKERERERERRRREEIGKEARQKR